MYEHDLSIEIITIFNAAVLRSHRKLGLATKLMSAGVFVAVAVAVPYIYYSHHHFKVIIILLLFFLLAQKAMQTVFDGMYCSLHVRETNSAGTFA